MAFTNIIDIIYPKGSVYLSTSNISPATLFGGTWSSVTTGVLAAASTLDNGYAKVGNKGGDFKIHNYQLPEHIHNCRAAFGYERIASDNDNWAGFWSSNASGGGLWPISGYGSETDGTVKRWLYAESLTGISGVHNQDFLPYHYSVNVWVRTA